MKKLSIVFSLLLAFSMLLAACANNQTGENTGVTGGTPGVLEETQQPGLPETGLTSTPEGGLLGEETETVMETEAITETQETAETPMATEMPMATETPMMTEAPMSTETQTMTQTQEITGTTQTNAAQIVGDRQVLTQLSNLVGFNVVDMDGQSIGTADDYIINTCESHIIYMLVNGDNGQMLIPFEAVTVNGGSLNANDNTIMLPLDASQISGAPTIDQRPDLSTTDWETQVLDYWNGQVRLSQLSTECTVPPAEGQDQGPVTLHKIAYATNLMGAELQDANQNVLGTVQDAYLEPESGQLFFVVVDLSDGGTVMVPMGAVTVPDRAFDNPDSTVLELLVDNNVLTSAPTIDSVDAAFQTDTQAVTDARSYWSDYVNIQAGQFGDSGSQ